MDTARISHSRGPRGEVLRAHTRKYIIIHRRRHRRLFLFFHRDFFFASSPYPLPLSIMRHNNIITAPRSTVRPRGEFICGAAWISRQRRTPLMPSPRTSATPVLCSRDYFCTGPGGARGRNSHRTRSAATDSTVHSARTFQRSPTIP